MKKKFVSLALICSMLVVLSACSSGTASTKSQSSSGVDEGMIKTVTDAAKKLKDTYNDYIVSTTMTAPDGNITYIEATHDGASYTEYSVDKDKKVGTISYGSQDSISYTMTDWITKDNKVYLFQTDVEGDEVTYALPETYNKYVSDRMMLYVNDLCKDATSIKQIDNEKITDKSNEEEIELSCYKMIVKSSAVKDILGTSTYGLYKSIVESSGENTSVGKLCTYYLQDLNMNLTFSDANVIVGIDQNGILKYMTLETGGLGSRLYYTKEVVATSNSNIRPVPDFSGAKDYSSSLSDLAEYVAQYDNYDDAVKALESYQPNSSEGSKVEEEEESDVKEKK